VKSSNAFPLKHSLELYFLLFSFNGFQISLKLALVTILDKYFHKGKGLTFSKFWTQMFHTFNPFLKIKIGRMIKERYIILLENVCSDPGKFRLKPFFSQCYSSSLQTEWPTLVMTWTRISDMRVGAFHYCSWNPLLSSNHCSTGW
jgi:hypothetical protein